MKYDIPVDKFDEFLSVLNRAKRILGEDIKTYNEGTYRSGQAKTLSLPGLYASREYMMVDIQINTIIESNNFKYKFLGGGITEHVCDCCGREKNDLFAFEVMGQVKYCGRKCLAKHFETEAVLKIKAIDAVYRVLSEITRPINQPCLYWKEAMTFKKGDRVELQLKATSKTHKWIPLATIDESLIYRVEFVDSYGAEYFVDSVSPEVSQMLVGQQYVVKATYQGVEGEKYKINHIKVIERI